MGKLTSKKQPSLDITADKDQSDSIEKRLFKVDPYKEAIDKFESLTWRDQQLILGRLVSMEQVVSLKLLPLAMGLFTLVAGGFITWAVKAALDGLVYMLVAFGAALVLSFLLWQMRVHRVNDAHLNAWTTVLKASHALRTKAEEEGWKLVPATTVPLSDPEPSESTTQLAAGLSDATPQSEPESPPQPTPVAPESVRSSTPSLPTRRGRKGSSEIPDPAVTGS